MTEEWQGKFLVYPSAGGSTTRGNARLNQIGLPLVLRQLHDQPGRGHTRRGGHQCDWEYITSLGEAAVCPARSIVSSPPPTVTAASVPQVEVQVQQGFGEWLASGGPLRTSYVEPRSDEVRRLRMSAVLRETDRRPRIRRCGGGGARAGTAGWVRRDPNCHRWSWTS